MNIRPHGSPTTFAMWVVVVLALVAAAAGTVLTLLIVTGLVVLAGGAVGLRRVRARSDQPQTRSA